MTETQAPYTADRPLTRLEHLLKARDLLKTELDRLTGQQQAIEAQLTQEAATVKQAQGDIADWEKVQALFGSVSGFAREQLKARVEQTVTAALQSIFEDSRLGFKIEIKTTAGKPAAQWQVVTTYPAAEVAKTVAMNPEDARGGGITDIVSLALRLALLELARPKPEGPVLLDEPGKHLSAEYVPNLAEFLKQYANRTGRQVIMVSHHHALADVADVAYRIQMDENGVSVATRLTGGGGGR